MTAAVARITVLHLRTVAPYRAQGLLVFGLLTLILARSPDHVVPALAVLLAPLIAVQPFVVADKAGLETLYAVLPVPRRTVLLGHYAWALESFLATALAGTALSVLLARAEGVPFGGRDLMTMVALSWALFSVNIAIQLPLLIRFGYARISVLGTTIPLALVMLAVYRLHLTITSIPSWLALLWAAGAVAIAISALLAVRAPRPRA
jgi:ABC-2 family transporter protein